MYHVLITDDERLERMAVRKVLDKNFQDTVKVYEAENGRRALEIIEEVELNLAILDIKMPVISGIEVAKEIKNKYPKCKIIMLTGFAYFTYAKECISIGVTEFLVKPFLDDELVNVISQAIQSIEGETIKVERDEIIDILVPEQVDTDWVCQIKSMIHKKYTSDLSMEDMANEVGFSTYYFSRMFKQEFGVNFVDYVTDLRLKKACELLEEGKCSVKEVCYKVGYSEPNYFTRVFKKMYGISPTKYQKQHIEK